jgi:predicted ester cyclase
MKTKLLSLLVMLLAFYQIQAQTTKTNTQTMDAQLEKNKAIVKRFNKEVIEEGNMKSFNELIANDVVNHAAPAGTPNGPASMSYFLMEVLRKGFSNITVEILDQIAEGDKVTTRKALHATHTGEFLGIPPSHKKVTILVIDIIRLEDEKYAEHWGMSNLSDVVQIISKK